MQGKVHYLSMLAIIATIHFSTLCEAEEIDFFARPGDVVLDEPQRRGDGTVDVYSPTGPFPRWHISQWSIPGGKLPTFQRSEGPMGTIYESNAAEAEIRIVMPADGESDKFIMAQNGRVLPCTNSNGSARESDLFVGAAGDGSKLPLVPAQVIPRDAMPALSRLKSLVISLEGESVGENLKFSKGCDVNQGSAIVSLILRNDFSNPKSVLFYQLSLYSFCGKGSPARVEICLKANTTEHFFSRVNPFGISDHVELFDAPHPDHKSPSVYEVDLLPRLVAGLKSGRRILDQDPEHWKVSGTYFGQIVWGDVSFKSTWKYFRVRGSALNN